MFLTGPFIALMLVQPAAYAGASVIPRHLPGLLVVSETFDTSLVYGLEVKIWELQPPSVDLTRVAAAVSRHRPDCVHLKSVDSWRFDCMGQDYLLTYLDNENEWFWAETQIPAPALGSHDVSWYDNSEVRIDNNFFDIAVGDLYRRELEQMRNQEVELLLHEAFQGSFILSYDSQQGRHTVVGWQVSEQQSWLLTVRGVRR